MSEENKKQLEQQLWNIANTLRGKMDADEFRDYILGFIFYKYLSEKMEDYADEILAEDNITYHEIVGSADEEDYIEAIKEEAIKKLGYFLRPEELFTKIASRGNGTTNNFILEDLTSILRNIEQTTMGTESEDDFVHLFEDLDLNSTKLGKTVDARNKLIVQVLTHLDKINFELKNHDRDVLGDAYCQVKPKLLERKKVIPRILDEIVGFVEKFLIGKRMKMIKNILILVFITSYVNAAVFGGSNLGFSGYNDHSCSKPMKPYKPYSFNSQWEIDNYNMEVENYNYQWISYISCIEEYLENANNDIKRIQEKQQEAIDEAQSR